MLLLCLLVADVESQRQRQDRDRCHNTFSPDRQDADSPGKFLTTRPSSYPSFFKTKTETNNLLN